MREIITVHVGQAGNSIGEKLWTLACEEHGIDRSGQFHGQSSLQLERVNVYFAHGRHARYVPRAIFVDLDQSSIDRARKSNYGDLFRPEWMIGGQRSASNNFAKGFFTEGVELLPESMDTIRRTAEECDLVHGFQFLHSISGGTGGGLGSLLIDRIREEYSDRLIQSYSICPALPLSQVVVRHWLADQPAIAVSLQIEPYNALLTLTHLIENTDETFCFDNMVLFDLLHQAQRVSAGHFADVNHLLAEVMLGVTACFRFPGQLNTDLRKLAVNMIPFPTLHFLLASFSPLRSRPSNKYQNLTEHHLVQQIFDRRNQMSAVDFHQGKYLTATGIFRGRTLSTHVLHELLVKEKLKHNFIPWIPNNVRRERQPRQRNEECALQCKVAHCDVSPSDCPRSVTAIGNHTGIRKQFDSCLQPFSKLFQRRAFLHWFVGEGMEELEFTDAENRVRDLIEDYRQYETATVQNDDDELDE